VIELPVSVLDPGLVQAGETRGQAVANMVAAARAAERLGFSRFWSAEITCSPPLVRFRRC
jgi:alkanesulfonate monooxygenase SsuD/methylene tetrahydromethanopterin reductase-like flavin-dependent oxidoreductase (luciferase family)